MALEKQEALLSRPHQATREQWSRNGSRKEQVDLSNLVTTEDAYIKEQYVTCACPAGTGGAIPQQRHNVTGVTHGSHHVVRLQAWPTASLTRGLSPVQVKLLWVSTRENVPNRHAF